MEILRIKCENTDRARTLPGPPPSPGHNSAVTWLHNIIWWSIFCPSLETSISLSRGSEGADQCGQWTGAGLIIENLSQAVRQVTLGARDTADKINYSGEEPVLYLSCEFISNWQINLNLANKWNFYLTQHTLSRPKSLQNPSWQKFKDNFKVLDSKKRSCWISFSFRHNDDAMMC